MTGSSPGPASPNPHALPDHLVQTRAAYDEWAAEWTNQTFAQSLDLLEQFVARCEPGPVLDLGCGPGWHLAHLGPAAVGLDLSGAMLALAAERAPSQSLTLGDLARLPISRGALSGVWASRTLVHLARAEVPFALAGIHHALAPGGHLAGVVFRGDDELAAHPAERFPGRTYSNWDPDDFAAALIGAGFSIEHLHLPTEPDTRIEFIARRLHTLPDFVGPDMTMLICGLNPSPSSADAGVGFFRAGNRFWPAALAAGLVARDRDPWHALSAHGIGMTDLAKRATRRADELLPDEYAEGLDRVAKIAERLRPRSICMVGLAGWRSAVDKTAARGWQPHGLGGVPVYLMPSTSGLNAHDTVESLTAHLRTAAAGQPS